MNWNALDEVIADLSWLRGSVVVIVVLDAQAALVDDNDWRAWLELTRRAALELADGGRVLRMVLQTEECEAVRLRLESAELAPRGWHRAGAQPSCPSRADVEPLDHGVANTNGNS